MRGIRLYVIVGLAGLFACALFAAGCGDDDTTSTTTSSVASAKEKIDSAVKSCSDTAQEVGGAVGAGLKTSCTTAGDTAKQALNSGSKNAKQALSQAASSCNQTAGQLPAGEAQTALKNLCNALASAG